MAHFVIVKDFTCPTKGIKTETVAGVSVAEWLESYYSKNGAFGQRMTCILNQDKLEFEDFATTFPGENDRVAFMPYVGDALTIIIAIVAIVLSVYVALSVEVPNLNGEDGQTENDPVYSLQGKKNTAKLGGPIPRCYGLNEVFPDTAMRPYNQFFDDDDHLYQGLCIGHGAFDIQAINITDSPASSFGAETQVVDPGGDLTLIPTNVETSSEVGDIRLFGPNEDDYPSPDGWFGPFVANASGSLAYRLELDVVFPKGAFSQNKKGRIRTVPVVSFEAQFQEIDGAGVPIGSWTTIFTESYTGGTTQVLRNTIGADLPDGRYQMRFRRTTDGRGDGSIRINDELHITGMRAFLKSGITYGDVTMLAVKAVATNNLNNQTANKVNVLCTAKLPTWDKAQQVWTEPVATRSIVWAFCDILRSNYGGQLADKFLDLDELYDIDQELTAEGRFFDWIFDKKTSVWEAAKLCARNARALPMPKGTVISMKRDKAQTIRKAMFAPQNILSNSLSWKVSMTKESRHDGIEVEYIDPTSRKPEQVLCTLDTDLGLKPRKIRFSGCTDRDWAYREGLYMRAQELDQKKVVTFSTGFEGLPVQYGDLIAVASDIHRDGSSTGRIVSIVGTTVTLSEPTDFSGANHVLALRNRTGGMSGPWGVTAGATEFEVELAAPITDDYSVDFDAEAPFYMFGEVAFADVVVTSMRPSTGENVEITAVNYSSRIFSFDALTAPALDSLVTTPETPSLPTVEELEVKQIPNNITFISAEWKPSLGAQLYVVQSSVDGILWVEVGETTATNLNIPSPIGVLYVRVAAVNVGRGAWTEWSGTVGVPEYPPSDVENLRLLNDFSGRQCDLTWDSVALAQSYEVKVYAVADPIGSPDGVLISTESVTGTTIQFQQRTNSNAGPRCA